MNATGMNTCGDHVGKALGKFFCEQNVAQLALLVGGPAIVSSEVIGLVLFDFLKVNARALALQRRKSIETMKQEDASMDTR